MARTHWRSRRKAHRKPARASDGGRAAIARPSGVDEGHQIQAAGRVETLPVDPQRWGNSRYLLSAHGIERHGLTGLLGDVGIDSVGIATMIPPLPPPCMDGAASASWPGPPNRASMSAPTAMLADRSHNPRILIWGSSSLAWNGLFTSVHHFELCISIGTSAFVASRIDRLSQG